MYHKLMEGFAAHEWSWCCFTAVRGRDEPEFRSNESPTRAEIKLSVHITTVARCIHLGSTCSVTPIAACQPCILHMLGFFGSNSPLDTQRPSYTVDVYVWYSISMHSFNKTCFFFHIKLNTKRKGLMEGFPYGCVCVCVCLISVCEPTPQLEASALQTHLSVYSFLTDSCSITAAVKAHFSDILYCLSRGPPCPGVPLLPRSVTCIAFFPAYSPSHGFNHFSPIST